MTKEQKDWSPALQTLEGHSGSVYAIVFSPDGKLVASASDDRTVSLWDSSTRAALQTVQGHSYYVEDIVFSPDGKLVVKGKSSQTLGLIYRGGAADTGERFFALFGTHAYRR